MRQLDVQKLPKIFWVGIVLGSPFGVLQVVFWNYALAWIAILAGVL